MDDALLHLEDVLGPLEWVKSENARTVSLVEGTTAFAELRADAKTVLESKDKIPRADQLTRHGAHFYALVEHVDYPRGVWRRCPTARHKLSDAEAGWEVLLDVSELSKREDRTWVVSDLPRMMGSRALVHLSDGGADAVVVREYDLESKSFVSGPGTFCIDKEAKTRITFVDADTVLVGSDFGPGSLTSSLYPRVLKLWKRGQPLSEAVTVYEGEDSDVSVSCGVMREAGRETVVMVGRSMTFYESQWFAWFPARGPEQRRFPTPESCSLSLWRGRAVVRLRKDWNAWPAGSLLAGDLEDVLARGEQALHVVFRPTATRVLENFVTTESRIVALVLDNVVSHVEEYRWEGGEWLKRHIKTPSPGSIDVTALWDPDEKQDELAEDLLVWYCDFLTPTRILQYRVGSEEEPLLVHQVQPKFATAGASTVQYFTASSDGVQVPYFVTFPPNAQPGKPLPCLLYLYGGFECSTLPFYSGMYGNLWLKRGGALAVGNVRGGGEFGPAWHQSARREKRQQCYDDVTAVARDLQARNISSPSQLVIEGGSNGGLTVAVAMLQQPKLYAAVLSQCALLDMKRYHRLLCGRSWMDEYGDPDDEADWAFISRYSPLQNVRPMAEGALPPVLFSASTRDDRVHPGHSRKMVARMRELGHQSAYLYENTEGGHNNMADLDNRARIMALEFGFLWMQIKQ